MNPIKYIRGSKNRASEIKDIFHKLNVKDVDKWEFAAEYYLYYIDNNIVNVVEESSSLGQLLIYHGEEIELPDEKKLPQTWEEWVKMNSYIKEEFYINTLSEVIVQNHFEKRGKFNYNNLSSKEDAEGILALIKLKRLRDYYNDGWEPHWEDGIEPKYCIELSSNKIIKSTCYNCNNFLAFRTHELRDEFMNNFSDLIEKAKMWL